MMALDTPETSVGPDEDRFPACTWTLTSRSPSDLRLSSQPCGTVSYIVMENAANISTITKT